jgi:hypothetical protein
LGWKKDFARRQVLLQASGSKQEQDQVPKWVVDSFWGSSRLPFRGFNFPPRTVR